MTNQKAGNWVRVCREIGPALAEASARHDHEGTFVAEAYAALREHRIFSMAVPAELGGGGATHAEACDALRELARHCPSAALSLSMHTHLVAATVWKYRHGKPGEQLLRRIAAEQLVLVSTGATDWVDSNGTMEKVDGGYRVTARKVFGSGSPGADMMIASARYEDPVEGPQVLHFPVPFSAEGVKISNDWNTLGMRGTGSNTVLLDRVFVPDAAIALRRPVGQWHAAWTVAAAVALPMIMAVYVGVAEVAAEVAGREAARKAAEPHTPYLMGELRNELVTAQIAWRSMVDAVAEYEFAPVIETADAALTRKTICARAAIATVERAMEVTGGRGFFRSFGLERLFRDIQACAYHPLPEKKQQRFSGMLAMGLDPITGESRA